MALSISPASPANGWPRAALLKHIVPALLVGLALRLFFLWRFPTVAGDSDIYEKLARNWIDFGVYGLRIQGNLSPVDVRAPGYPGFLAMVYLVLSPTRLAVRLAQTVLDLASCLLIASLAARVAAPQQAGTPPKPAMRAYLSALWLAALCPFTANYVAVVLGETLIVFLTTAALLLLVIAWQGDGVARWQELSRGQWLAAGCVIGLGTLVRPETPLLLVAVALVITARCLKRGEWQKLLRIGILLAGGVLLPLLPWAARNWITLGRVQFLSARYAELSGEYVPHGFSAWTGTWLVRFRDVYLVSWKVEDQEIDIDDLPASAFDSSAERDRVAALLHELNDDMGISPQLDAKFGELARERTRRHPLRTYLWVPLQRLATLWFTPRIELLPYSGRLWPLAEQYADDPTDFSVTLGLAAVNVVYLGLGLAGLWVWLRRRQAVAMAAFPSGVALLVIFVAVRALYFLQVDTPEPRYLLECFPVVIALAAQAWAGSPEKLSPLPR